MAGPRILITGVTGYIGGSVLATLLTARDAGASGLSSAVITAPVRKTEQAQKLEGIGVNPVLFDGLDDLEFLAKAASEHDIVINTANAAHTFSAIALIKGLAIRRNETGKDVYMIQTSGTSNIADNPITGIYTEPNVLSDKHDIYSYEKYRESIVPYPQRTTDVAVVEEGERTGVKTYILQSPTIYGIGGGLFNRTTLQTNALMRSAKRLGYTPVIGSGDSEWSHVHIDDLTALYELIIRRILAGDDIPNGRSGIYFNETGRHTWKEVSERVAQQGHALGYLPSTEIRSMSPDEASAKKVDSWPPTLFELALGSRSVSKAILAREIGWVPVMTRGDFEASFAKQWEIIGKEKTT